MRQCVLLGICPRDEIVKGLARVGNALGLDEVEDADDVKSFRKWDGIDVDGQATRGRQIDELVEAADALDIKLSLGTGKILILAGQLKFRNDVVVVFHWLDVHLEAEKVSVEAHFEIVLVYGNVVLKAMESIGNMAFLAIILSFAHDKHNVQKGSPTILVCHRHLGGIPRTQKSSILQDSVKVKHGFAQPLGMKMATRIIKQVFNLLQRR